MEWPFYDNVLLVSASSAWFRYNWIVLRLIVGVDLFSRYESSFERGTMPFRDVTLLAEKQLLASVLTSKGQLHFRVVISIVYYVHHLRVSATVFNNKVSLSKRILFGELAKIRAISRAVSKRFNST